MNTKIENSSVMIVDKSISSGEESKSNNKDSDFLNIPLGESIYEPITKSTIQKDKIPTDFGKSIKEDDNKLSASMNVKDLSSSLGVKLVLKIENGKAKFVTMPTPELANSMNETKYKSFINVEDKHDPKIEEENDIENVENIVLNLKRTSSKV
jgi:hypothetical protein